MGLQSFSAEPSLRSVEDGPHTIRVLLVDDDEDFAVLASTLLETESEHIETVTETHPKDALELIDPDNIDCIVSDYRMPGMDGIEFLEAVREEYPDLPFILFTGKGSEEIARQAISAGVDDYIVKDGSSAQYAVSANRIENLVGQYRTRRRAIRKQTLDTLFQAVVREILHEPTRESIEQGVCDRLVSSDLYSFAWIGERDLRTGEIRPRAWAGMDKEEFLDSVPFFADRTPPRSVEECAITMNEVRIATGFSPETGSGEWYTETVNAGFEAAIGIPIVSEEIPYGVLGVYTERENAFLSEEIEALELIATLSAFSIGASERRHGETSRRIIELDFDVDTTEIPFARIASMLDTRVQVSQTTHRPDGTKLTVYTVSNTPPERVRELESTLGADVHHFSERVPSETDVAIVSTSPWWEELHQLFGASIGEAVADGSTATLRIELPTSADVRSVVDHMESRFPGAEPTARRERSRPERSVDDLRTVLGERLTDRQREVLETAYHAGYYEWPHESSSQEIAEMLGIAQPTFAEHFWTGQRRIVQLLLESDDTQENDP